MSILTKWLGADNSVFLGLSIVVYIHPVINNTIH